jgi:hypothetical protein
MEHRFADFVAGFAEAGLVGHGTHRNRPRRSEHDGGGRRIEKECDQVGAVIAAGTREGDRLDTAVGGPLRLMGGDALADDELDEGSGGRTQLHGSPNNQAVRVRQANWQLAVRISRRIAWAFPTFRLFSGLLGVS